MQETPVRFLGREDVNIGRMPCEDEDGDRSGWSFTSQGMPKIINQPPEPRREAWNLFSLTASEGTIPADILISDFQPPEP